MSLHHNFDLKDLQNYWHVSYKSYLIGFFGSLILTLASFLLTLNHPFTRTSLVITLISLAITQALLQLIFFLHLTQEKKPRWNLITFFFTLVILLIVLLGSLWIMHDLNTRMM